VNRGDPPLVSKRFERCARLACCYVGHDGSAGKEEDSITVLRTPLCHLLGIQYPILQAPMAGGWTTPALVSEVSNAGGLGMLAGARVFARSTPRGYTGGQGPN
jgi:hypothetical protein